MLDRLAFDSNYDDVTASEVTAVLSDANTLGFEHVQEVTIFVAKVLCNLSRSSPNRKQMLHEESMPVLIASLRKFVEIGEHGSFMRINSLQAAQDVLRTLLYLSRTTFVHL